MYLSSKHFFRKGFWSIVLISFLLLSGCTTLQFKPQVQSQPQFEQESQLKSQSQAVVQNQPLSEPEVARANSKSQHSFEFDTNFHAQVLPIPKAEIESPPPIHQTKALPQSEIPILYYHSIGKEDGNELRIPPEEYEAQLQFLHQNGYQSITIHELYRHFYEGYELPKKPFVMTFDDGYADNYSNAFRIAKKYGFLGTVFMVTDWINGIGYLSNEQLLEMSREGWQIEAHTMSHPKLNEIPLEQLERELSGSKSQLEAVLNRPVKYLAYPYGNYSEEVIKVAKMVGYAMGFTTERGWAKKAEAYKIQRIYCYANMGVVEFKRRVENPNY
jgi:peptidoglycan/xylan/chitin deacetylase (PgdA/CDA1 family)